MEFKTNDKTAERKMNRVIKAIEKFNADMQSYIDATESNELPVIGTTVTGYYAPLDPATIKVLKTKVRVELDGERYELRPVRKDGEWEIDGWDDYYDGLKQDITYQRSRLRKAWRIWKSENPDLEEERDDDDED